MILVGESCDGGRVYRAPSLLVADEFSKRFGGYVEYGLYLHRWYVVL